MRKVTSQWLVGRGEKVTARTTYGLPRVHTPGPRVGSRVACARVTAPPITVLRITPYTVVYGFGRETDPRKSSRFVLPQPD